MEVSNLVRIQYERLNPVTSETKCQICIFPIDVFPKGVQYKESNMSYLDFLIRKEHTFIRNIFDKEVLQKSRYLKSLEDYHKAMCIYIQIVKVAEIELKNVYCYDNIYDDTLQNFLKEECPAYEYDIPGLIEEIKSIEVRNFKSKILKCVIQLYAFFISV